jgi:succinyl-CoA synthetase beta subunit
MQPQQLIEEARNNRRTSLDEQSGKRLLAHFGVAVPRSIVVQSGDDLASELAALKAPYVVKVMSPRILHKSDVGGVRVRLTDAAEVGEAIESMIQNPAIAKHPRDGFLVEEMASPGQELVIGAVRDPQFGPLVMVGLGGIFVEVLKDVAFRICPIERIDAGEMLDELKGKALLDGARGQSKVSKQAIIDVLLKVGGAQGLLMQLADDIAEADLNPLICSSEGAVAVDARFILTPKAVP